MSPKMVKRKPVGWRNDHARHVAAGKGMKSGRKIQVPRGLTSWPSSIREWEFIGAYNERSSAEFTAENIVAKDMVVLTKPSHRRFAVYAFKPRE